MRPRDADGLFHPIVQILQLSGKLNDCFGSIAAGHVGPKRSERCVKLYCCKLRTRQASTRACVKHCFDALHIEIARFHRGACVKHYCSPTVASWGIGRVVAYDENTEIVAVEDEDDGTTWRRVADQTQPSEE